MKRTNIYILLAIICCVGCNNTIDLNNQVISSPKAKVETLSYKDLLNNDSPLLTVIDIKNCNNEDSPSLPFVHTKNWDDNTYVGLLDKYKVKFHNEFDLKSYAQNHHIKLRRNTMLLTEEDSTSSDIMVTITNGVMPLTIIRPYVEECGILPNCYYDEMEIEWNEDPNNPQGIVVLIQWTGIVLDGEGTNEPVYNLCLLEDTGVGTLDNAMFDNIPDRAYVTMFLIRANILQVEDNGGIVDIPNYDWDAIIDAYPEVGCQATNVAVGCAAKFSFRLIREL